MKFVSVIAVAVLLAFPMCPAVCALDNGASLSGARAVWLQGASKELNRQLVFSGTFEWKGGEKPRLVFASSNPCRVRLNDRFAWYGPARGPEGFFRTDDVALDAERGLNRLEIECAGYNCESFYFQRQDSFLMAAVVCGGRTVLRTAASGDGIFSARGSARVRKVSRYGHARMFGEAYVLPQTAASSLPLEELPAPRLLPRIVEKPCFELMDDFIPVSAGACAYDSRAETRPVVFVDNAGRSGKDGFRKDELEYNLWDMQQRFRPEEGRAPEKTETYFLGKERHLLFESPVNRTGFPGLSVRCIKPGEIHLLFDERPVPGEFKPWRSVVANDIVWRIETPGTYELESFEPYTLKACRIVARSGSFEVSSPRLRLYRNSLSRRARLTSSDKDLELLFAAAEENYAQNSVDGFMDCPGRERAGWNCDAFFTARVSHLLSGSLSQETLFLDNFAKPGRFGNIPEGMLPMCYPADFADGNFIPSWAMFFVLQLEEYANARGGDPALVQELKPKVLDLVAFLSRYRNADGLLEKLPRWVFVEWSAANRFVQDVNYPNNMIWAAMLEAVDRLYGRDDLRREARRVKAAIRSQSWTGEWFCDNAVRGKNGELALSGECSETCQYYAFYFGCADPDNYPRLYRRLMDDFGPDRKLKGLYPRIHHSAPFIGNFLRLDWLGRQGAGRQVYEEMRGYFLPMARSTGTLWENADSSDNGSCCHGFASHVAVFIVRDVVGLKSLDRKKRIAVLAPPEDIGISCCRLELPLGDETAVFGWKSEKGTLRTDCALPDGWKVVNR